MLVLRTSSYNEDDTPNVLDFIEDQEQEVEPTFPLNVSLN